MVSNQRREGAGPPTVLDRLSLTSRRMAAIRSRESERNDAPFRDLLAAVLAADVRFACARRMAELRGSANPAGETRTRYFDDLPRHTAGEQEIEHVVRQGATGFPSSYLVTATRVAAL